MGPSIAVENKPVDSSEKNQQMMSRVLTYTSAVLCGALLGLSAPGIGFWLYAWVGLAPLFILIAHCRRKRQAAICAFAFGLAYNCVYLNWLLGLAPLDWLGFDDWQSRLMSIAALLIVSTHQALIFALFALIYRILPLKSILLLNWQGRHLELSRQWVLPLLWVLIFNKIGNAHCLTGVPWSMIEYSQYKELPLIQIASLIGGIGVGYLLVLANITVAIGLVSFFKWRTAQALNAPSIKSAACQILAATMVLLMVLGFGQHQLSLIQPEAASTISIVQPNINIDMQKSEHRYSLMDLLDQEERLAAQCPPGICVWPESSVPTRLARNPVSKERLSCLAKVKKLELIVGSIEEDIDKNVYNAAYVVSTDGTLSAQAYRKQYLVPFGEYTPLLVRNMPDWLKRLTNTPAGAGYSSGTRSQILALSEGSLAPLICFETISPELASAGVRAGGQLLVNLSDLAWFHQSIIGEQMLACAVFRAVENRRFFVFAANTGPSAIVSPAGTISAQLRQGITGTFTGKVGFISKLTFFTRWFLF